MIGIALNHTKSVDREEVRTAVAEGRFVVTPNYPRDVASGVLGMSAMVLPGISGAYMLLVLDRYETILAAIAEAKRFVFSGNDRGTSMSFLQVLIPTAIGAVLSVVLLSNLFIWISDDWIIYCAVLSFIDVLDPTLMRVEWVNAQCENLDISLAKFIL